MKNLLEEIKDDASFIKSHKLQPQWYKVAKSVGLIIFFWAYWYFFGGVKTGVFFGVFIFLSLIVHFVYRARTNKFTQSWLDFVVTEENDVRTPTGIGKFYYSAVTFNAIVALVISQLM